MATPVCSSSAAGLSGALTWSVVGAGAAAAASARRAARDAASAARASSADENRPPFALDVPVGGGEPAAALRESVHVRFVDGGAAGGCVAVPARCKAVLLEDVAGVSLRLPAGALAGVELLRCRDVTVEIGGAVSCVRLDDCIDCAVLFDGDAAADGPGADAAGGAAGVSVFASGCRKVRLGVRRQGAAEVSTMVPETVVVRLPAAASAFSHGALTAERPWAV
jgi:hypothetical protein